MSVALDGEVNHRLVSWWDRNWFTIDVMQPGVLTLDFTAPKNDEFGLNISSNGWMGTMVAPDGVTGLGSFNAQAGQTISSSSGIATGPLPTPESSDQGSYNAEMPYLIRARWSAMRPK